MNGKLSLTQAEAVMDLIAARGRQAARVALSSRDGSLYQEISSVSRTLVETAAHLSAWVDYPDDEIPEITEDELMQALQGTCERLQTLLASYDRGRVLREGVDTVIVGRPNVGKSTLMNLLSGTQRSIVTEIPGTTRDIVEETVQVGGVTLRLADTAGLRETEDRIEQMGVGLARKRLETADLVLAVFDSADELNDEDLRLLGEIAGRPAVAVINKSDLPRRVDLDLIAEKVGRVVLLSAKSGSGAEELSVAVEEVTGLSQFDAGAALLANERQRKCAKVALSAVREALGAMEQKITFDAVNVCIDEAIGALLELTGEKAGDAVVNEVFARFCVGK